ncbi:hypothetical protein [Psychrobacillus sp. FSL K6-1464]|uniref:hypothetical protein n=1 Tax=Psychrobacillus sp. FSL K6-1464 TaxID=2921545 RepID=UPI0030F6AC74
MEAKVIKIISDKEIVLNVGKDKGVKVGDIFEVIAKEGDRVYDPDTNEFLGTLDIPKATLIVEYVYPRMCICTNNAPAIDPFTSPLAIGIIPRLNVDLNQVSGGFEKHSLAPIQIGDFAYLDDSF